MLGKSLKKKDGILLCVFVKFINLLYCGYKQRKWSGNNWSLLLKSNCVCSVQEYTT